MEAEDFFPEGNSRSDSFSHLALILLIFVLEASEAFGQNTVVQSGTSLSATGGTIIISGTLLNNGNFVNSDDNVFLQGSSATISGTTPAVFEDLTVATGCIASISTPGQRVKGIVLCNGTLNSNGNIILASSAEGTASIDGRGTGEVTGNVVMERYLPSFFGYRYISSPFQAATVGELADDIDLSSSQTLVYRYDENRTITGWVSYKAAGNALLPMNGYAVNFGSSSSPGVFDIAGVVNNSPVTMNLYNHNYTYTRGYTLVGNPYPSPIDWDASTGWIRTNIDNAIYLFRNSTDKQYSGVYSSYISGVSSDGNASRFIPSMQGFFVHVTDGSFPVTGTLAMNNNVRVTDQAQPFLKSTGKGVTSLLRLVANYTENALSSDPLVIYCDHKSTLSFDSRYDALKLYNTDPEVVSFYSCTENGIKVSINAIPFSDTIPFIRLGIKTSKNGNVSIAIKDITGLYGCETIYLTDKVSGKTVLLTCGTQFEVYLLAGEYNDRFVINIPQVATLVDDGERVAEVFTIRQQDSNLEVDINELDQTGSLLIITNISGQILVNMEISYPGHFDIPAPAKAGVYITSFVSGDKRVSKKLIIRE
ncbi:MAG: hypothetical protein U0X39_15790 [Bacteroidales bacterium]